MSDIVSAEAAAQEGEALLPSAELAKNLGLTLAASVVLTFSTIVYMQGGLHSYFYAQSAYALPENFVARALFCDGGTRGSFVVVRLDRDGRQVPITRREVAELHDERVAAATCGGVTDRVFAEDMRNEESRLDFDAMGFNILNM